MYKWEITKNISDYKKVEKGYIIVPDREEIRKLIKSKTEFNVIAPYEPPKEFKDIFIVINKDKKVLSEQEEKYLKEEAKKKAKTKEEEKIIYEHLKKRRIEEKTGIKIYKPSLKLSDLGGLNAVKDLANTLRNIKPFTLFFPKGILLVGIPGTGKSYSVKALAGELNRYLIEIDLTALLESDNPIADLEKILNTIEEMELECILWVDEFEKPLSDPKGVKLVGKLLTILNEFHSDTGYMINGFWWFTANNITILSEKFPELFRSGRFDRKFFVNLPSYKSAEEIFKIYFKKYLLAPKDFVGLYDEKKYYNVYNKAKEFFENPSNMAKLFSNYRLKLNQVFVDNITSSKAYREIKERFFYTPAEINYHLKYIAKDMFLLGDFSENLFLKSAVHNTFFVKPIIFAMEQGIMNMLKQKDMFEDIEKGVSSSI